MNSIKVEFALILLKKINAHLSRSLSSIYSSLCKVLESRLGLELGTYSRPFLVQAKGNFCIWERAGLRPPLGYILSDYLGFNGSKKLTVDKCYLRIVSTHSCPHLCFLDYKNDPYSRGDPCNTICCREDLNSLNPSPGGCYDTKVTC